MFVSAALDLQTHSYSEEGVESHPFLHPPSRYKVLSVSICNDNSYIAVLRENEKPQIFSAKEKRSIRPIHTINLVNATAITFKHTTKRTISIGTGHGDVVLYDTKSRTASNTISKVTDSVKVLDFTCDDQQLCGFDGDVLFVFPEINVNSNVLKYKQLAECTFLRCHPFIPSRVAVGSRSGRIGLWDVQHGVEIFSVNAFNSPITGLAMSSCGKFLVASGKDVKVCGVDLSKGGCTFQLDLEQEKAVTAVDLSPNDKLLAVGLVDGTVKIYDVKQQLKELYSAKLHHGPVSIIAFENKGKELNSNFSSMIKISVQEMRDEAGEVANSANSTTNKNNDTSSSKGVEGDTRNESLEKMKNGLMKVIKNEMDSLENQLQEHCVKFQKFLDNEFDTIDNIFKKKWDVFNVGDMNQIIKAICPDDSKSNCT